MLTVLIVDDHFEMASTIAGVVSSVGGEPVVVHTGFAALQHLTANSVDLMILDDHMPGMTGIDVLRTLQEAGDRGPPVVMFSASDRNRENALQFGAIAALLKTQFDELVSLIESHRTPEPG